MSALPRKQTFSNAVSVSAKCHQQTSLNLNGWVERRVASAGLQGRRAKTKETMMQRTEQHSDARNPETRSGQLEPSLFGSFS